MNSLFVNGRGNSRLLWLSLMACCVTLPGLGAERSGGRLIEFSTPRGEAVSTNFADANAEKLQENRLKQKLQEESSRPSGLLGSRGSLDGVMAVPYRPPPTTPAQNRRRKELLDQRRNWVFMSPEELGAGASLEETSDLPDFDAAGEKKAGLSVIERFYQRLERQGDLQGDRAAAKAKAKGSGESPSGEEEESPLSRRVTEVESTLKRILDANPTGDYLSKGNDQGFFSDWLGQTGPNPLTAEPTPAQKSRREEFKQLFEPRLTPDAAPNSGLPTISGASLPKPVPSWMPPAPPTVSASPGDFNARNGLGLTALPGLNSAAASQPNYAPPPLPELQRSPAGMVLPPQRKF